MCVVVVRISTIADESFCGIISRILSTPMHASVGAGGPWLSTCRSWYNTRRLSFQKLAPFRTNRPVVTRVVMCSFRCSQDKIFQRMLSTKHNNQRLFSTACM